MKRVKMGVPAYIAVKVNVQVDFRKCDAKK